MVMVADLVPGLKRWLRGLDLREAALALVLRMVVAFLLHRGRMSCLQAAGAVRSDARHRAQISRQLRRPSFRGLNINQALRQQLLALESLRGPFVFIIDATLCSQSGKHTENTHSTGNRQRRPRKGRRYGKQKHPRKSCHSFTMGLLITPSGLRLPFSIPHYTREYCRKKGLVHRTTAESAADLIRQLPLPEEAEVVVLGDTAYEAEVVRAACAARGYDWIFPCNSERVLAGPKGKRPQVRSLLQDWSSWKLAPIRFCPGQGPYVNYRRLSPHRIGPKAKPRTFYVHQERRNVHSLGEVRILFSTAKPKLAKATPDDVKILLTNSRRSLREVIELYALRWQIELFFKELKSTLGFHQYRFQQFDAVESWVELALTAFLYLEGYRARQLARWGLSDKQKQWWRRQRTHGLCQAVYQATAQSELEYLRDRLDSPGGIAKLKRLIRQSFAPEYQSAI
jgi:hypothetical protein